MREIETARLRVRMWREDDLAPYARICADPEVMRCLSGPMTREHSEQQISKLVHYWEERGFGLWAVEEKSSGAFIGIIGLLYHEDRSEGKHRMEVGWCLARPFWGRGLATEGAMASLRYGFEEVGLDHIISIAVPENLASRRVMEKVGMTLRGEIRFKGSDVVWYAVERQVWEASGA